MTTGADFRSLLEKTSRSFFLGIEQLSSPLKEDLTLAYLLCRVLDTFEDSVEIEASKRLMALDQSLQLLQLLPLKNPSTVLSAALKEWEHHCVSLQPHNEHENSLLKNSTRILEAIIDLSTPKQEAFRDYLVPMAKGMEQEVKRRQLEGNLSPRDMAEFESYCYAVAGTVGDLISALFSIEGVFNGNKVPSSKSARSFGHCLQIVNILKDFHQDWKAGRCFWPGLSLPKEKNSTPPDLQSLEQSHALLVNRFSEHAKAVPEYLEAIRKDRKDAAFFCVFPYNMALASLEASKADPSWLKEGRSFKVSRLKTIEILQSALSNCSS